MQIGKYNVNVPAVLTGLFLTVAHLIFAFTLYSSFESSGYSFNYINSTLPVFSFPFALVMLFSPIIFFIAEIKLVLRYDWKKAWKMFGFAEIWTFVSSMFCWLIIQSGGNIPLPAVVIIAFSYIATFLYVRYLLRIQSPENQKPKESFFEKYIACIASGSAVYAAVVWTFFFIFLMSQIWYLFSSLSFSYISDFGDVVQVLVTFFYLGILLFVIISPYLITIEYLNVLDAYKFNLIAKLPKYARMIILGGVSFLAIYWVAMFTNGSYYQNSKNSTLLLSNEQSYASLYKMSGNDLKTLFIDTYRAEHKYVADKTLKLGTTLYCNGDELIRDCSIADKLINLALNPLMYQGEFVLPNGSGDVTTILHKLYETNIPKSIPVSEITSALSGIGYSGGYRPAIEIDNALDIQRTETAKTVALKVLSVQTTVYPISGTQKNEVTLSFSTASSTNQQAQLLLTLPEGSVVTDLLLGRNLEMSALVAPKGAANTVYEKSIAKRIDPAVLRKVSGNTYSLKVFPVYPNLVYVQNNGMRVEDYMPPKNWGNQQVKITYFSPVSSRVELPLVKNVLNTGIDTDSVISGKITVVGTTNITGTSDTVKVDSSTSETTNSIINWSSAYYASYMDGSNTVVLSKNIAPYCVESKVFTQNATAYLDISYGARSWKNEYTNILSSLAEKYGTVTVVTYNNDIRDESTVTTKATAESFVNDLVFWGYSSKQVTQKIAEKTDTTNDIFVVTDGDIYAMDKKYDDQYDYSISKAKVVIVYVDTAKELRPELGAVISKNGGAEVFASNLSNYLSAPCSSILASTLSTPEVKVTSMLTALRTDEKTLGDITDSDTYVKVGRKMFKTAGMNHFVDFMNSFIAVETELQKQQLMEETAKETAFDVAPTTAPSSSWSPVVGFSPMMNMGKVNSVDLGVGTENLGGSTSIGGTKSSIPAWTMLLVIAAIPVGVIVVKNVKKKTPEVTKPTSK